MSDFVINLELASCLIGVLFGVLGGIVSFVAFLHGCCDFTVKTSIRNRVIASAVCLVSCLILFVIAVASFTLGESIRKSHQEPHVINIDIPDKSHWRKL